MEELLTFSSLADAMAKGRQAVKSTFTIEEGAEGNEEEKNYEMIFNSHWAAKAKPLSSRLAAFFAAFYKTEGLTIPELMAKPGISTTQEVVCCWRQIVTTLHPDFVRETTAVTEKIFSSPEFEVELSSQVRKKCHEHQLGVFNKLQTTAMMKLQELDEFVGLQVDVRFHEFSQKVRGIRFNWLMKEGFAPSTQATHSGVPHHLELKLTNPMRLF